eukprot:3940138-Rhodomonas_salina.1
MCIRDSGSGDDEQENTTDSSARLPRTRPDDSTSFAPKLRSSRTRGSRCVIQNKGADGNARCPWQRERERERERSRGNCLGQA